MAEDSISMSSLLLVAIGISPDKEPSPLLSRLINTDREKKRKTKDKFDLKCPMAGLHTYGSGH